ncbi:hypothetical protein ACQ4PT_046124 [Festuca glaucescens]
METEASFPSLKKRKLAAPKSHGVPPALEATGSPGSEPPPPAHDQQPPPGDAADRISDLADAILGEIVSLLPSKQAVRTQILSPRWRHIWSSAPLILDCEDLLPADADEDVLAGLVSNIVSVHPGPGRRFCVPSCFLRDRAAAVEAWLRSPTLDSLQELEFWFKSYYRPQPLQQPPPPSTVRFSATLRVLTMGNCNLPDSTVQELQFPLLKHLGLGLVSISECSLHGLITACPALECLLISHGFGFCCLKINSLTLRSRLLHQDFDYGLHVSVVSAPKLETLGCLSDGFYISGQDDLSRIVFGSTVIQGLHVDKLATVVHTVKILSVTIKTLSLDSVIGLMRCFPSLEKVYIEQYTRKENNEWRRKHWNLITCLDIRLKEIVLDPYLGTKSDINLASLFVMKARVLELMTFMLEPRDYNDNFLAEQRRKLQLEKRASRGAQFHFTTDRSVRRVSDMHHVRDLDLIDPFVCC